MKHPRPTLAALALLLTTACAGRPTPPPPPPPAPPAPPPVFTPGAAIQWTPDARAVIVDDRFVHTVDAGAWRPLDAGRAPVIAAPGGALARLEPGRAILLADPPRPLPFGRFVDGAEAHTAGFWLDEARIYLHQTDPTAGAAACRVLDTATGALSAPPGGCIEPSMVHAWRFDRGPGDLVAVHSAGEGHPAVDILRYTAEGGPRPAPGPDIDLYPSGPLTVAFTADAKAALLLTPCALGTTDRPCAADAAEDAPWGVYRWTFADGRLSPKLFNIPPGAALAPTGRSVAWIADGRLCVAPRDALGTPTCSAPAR